MAIKSFSSIFIKIVVLTLHHRSIKINVIVLFFSALAMSLVEAEKNKFVTLYLEQLCLMFLCLKINFNGTVKESTYKRKTSNIS